MMVRILEQRLIFFVFSGILALISLYFIFFGKLNYGIDMTGGIQLEFENNANLSTEMILQEAQTIAGHININGDVINNVNSYAITGENIFVVEVGFNNSFSESEIESYKNAYKTQLEDIFAESGDISLSKYTNIGASFGEYIKNTAKLTLVIAILGIAAYIAFAFSGTVSGISSMSFAIITLLTLFHDVIISSGLYILTSSFFPQFQIDTFFITALLTILGYSINDTIVVFDRIRSNLRDYAGKGKELFEIISDSLRETFTRSIYTSLTLVFTLVCILIFGPNSISGFTLAMLFGTIVGTFSSICIASPLLYEFHKNTTLAVYTEKKALSADDKTVV